MASARAWWSRAWWLSADRDSASPRSFNATTILAVRQVSTAPRPVSGLGLLALRRLARPVPEAAG